MSTETPHIPFDCGTHSMDWRGFNCHRCRNYDDDEPAKSCPMELAILTGRVSDDVAERIGFLDNSPPRAEGFAYMWRCKEFIDVDAPEPAYVHPNQLPLPLL